MQASRPDRAMGRSWISHLIAALVIGLAVYHGLGEASATPLGFDEAYNLNLIKTLARDGVYASKLVGEDYRYFDPDISTGPALVLPYAAGVRIFGARLSVVRGMAIVALAVSLLLVYAAGIVILGQRAAPLFLALFAYAPLVIEFGVWVQGDILAIALGLLCLAFFILGQRQVRPSLRIGLYVASGLALGTALLMKDILILFAAALLLVVCAEFLRRRRISSALEMLIPVVISLAVYVSWRIFPYIYLRLFLSPQLLQVYALRAAERAALMRQAVILNPFSHTIPALVDAFDVFRPMFLGCLIFPLLLLFPRVRRSMRAGIANLSIQSRLLSAAVLVWLTWYFLLSGRQATVRHLLPGVILLELLLVWLAKSILEALALEGDRTVGLSNQAYLVATVLLFFAAWSLLPGWQTLTNVPAWKTANKAAQDETVAWLSENVHDDAPLYGWGWFVPWSLGYLADRELGRVLPGDAGADVPGWFVLTPELGSTGNLDEQVGAFVDTLGAPAFENSHYRIYAYDP